MTKPSGKEHKPVIYNANGFGLAKGSGSLNPGGRPKNWRTWLRDRTQNGAEIHDILLSLARGEARMVKLLDGREQVIVPTSEVQARVAIHLDEMLHGKAVTQNEQQRAEREASALAAVQALSDDELARRARAALQRGTFTEDAQLVTITFHDLIWEAYSVPGDTLPLEDTDALE